MAHAEQLVKQALLSALHFSNITEINIHDRLREDLHLDSMSSLMFLIKLEEFIPGFYVDPETLHANDLETISSVIRYVNSQMLERSEYAH